jgi:hypothetical protein
VDVGKFPNHINTMSFSLFYLLFLLILFIIGVCTVTTDHNNWNQSQVLEASSLMSRVGTSSVKFDVMKFDGTCNFGLWQSRVKDLLVQQGMVKALYGTKPNDMADIDWKELEAKAMATIRLCLGDDMMYHVMDEEFPTTVWLKLESQYMSKSLTNKLYLKQLLYELKMTEG